VEHFDVVIIGSGSGNSLVTPELARWRVAIVEEGTFGGTCLNVGCVPTKMYVYAADVAETIRDSSRYGVDATLDGVRWADVRDRVFGRIDPISSGGRGYRERGPNTTLFSAHAAFTGDRTLALSTGEELRADQVVVATGSRPVIPEHVTRSGVPFHTSDTIMRIARLPRQLAILGGGYISAEFAHVFSAFGAQVTIISRSAPLLRHLDLQIAHRFTELARERWDVRLDATVRELRGDEEQVRLTLDDGSVVTADMLLVAAGRVPNADRLEAQRAGIARHEDGRVAVDEHQRTTAAGVWALGDVCSPRQLKHVSNHEARVVAHNLAHPDDLIASDHRFVPAAVFTHPQIATVGLTSEEARAAGRTVVTATVPFGDTAYGWAMEDTSSLAKVLADPISGRMLGAHLIGPQAATLIQPLIQAMSLEEDIRGWARGQYWIHPALSEVVENAVLRLPFP
jgi:mycothione reductase